MFYIIFVAQEDSQQKGVTRLDGDAVIVVDDESGPTTITRMQEHDSDGLGQLLRGYDGHVELQLRWLSHGPHSCFDMVRPSLIDEINCELLEAKAKNRQLKNYLHNKVLEFPRSCLESLRYGVYLIGMYRPFSFRP
jgi:hypothetical protein